MLVTDVQRQLFNPSSNAPTLLATRLAVLISLIAFAQKPDFASSGVCSRMRGGIANSPSSKIQSSTRCPPEPAYQSLYRHRSLALSSRLLHFLEPLRRRCPYPEKRR